MEKNFNANVNTSHETHHIIDVSDRMYKLPVTLISVLAVFLAGYLVYSFKALPQNTPREINISGEGKAIVKPDIAMISFGVTAKAAKSQDAVNQSNEKMNDVIKTVKGLGVEDNDIQTTYYSLSPVYGSDVQSVGVSDRSMIYPYPVPNNKIVGYSLEQQIQVKIRNFDKINSILDGATASGANMVGSLQFTVDDMEKVRAEARGKAIEQAKEKAEMLGEQTGLDIEKIVNISEGYGGGYPVSYGQGYAGVAMEKSVAPDIQPGQMEVVITVTLTYRVE